jgi:hypothetical protein
MAMSMLGSMGGGFVPPMAPMPMSNSQIFNAMNNNAMMQQQPMMMSAMQSGGGPSQQQPPMMSPNQQTTGASGYNPGPPGYSPGPGLEAPPQYGYGNMSR